MTEKDKAAKTAEKTVRVEIIAKRGVNFTEIGTVYPGSVVELSAGHAANAINRKWAKKTDAKLKLELPEDVAVQLGKKTSTDD